MKNEPRTKSVSIGLTVINNIRFADDTAIMVVISKTSIENIKLTCKQLERVGNNQKFPIGPQ